VYVVLARTANSAIIPLLYLFRKTSFTVLFCKYEYHLLILIVGLLSVVMLMLFWRAHHITFIKVTLFIVKLHLPVSLVKPLCQLLTLLFPRMKNLLQKRSNRQQAMQTAVAATSYTAQSILLKKDQAKAPRLSLKLPTILLVLYKKLQLKVPNPLRMPSRKSLQNFMHQAMRKMAVVAVPTKKTQRN